MIAQKIFAPLQRAGIEINGNRSFDPQVHNERVYQRVARYGRIGLADSYADKDWDCEDLAELFNRLVRAGGDKVALGGLSTQLLTWVQKLHTQTPHEASHAIHHHYDIGIDYYRPALGPTMNYTCSYGLLKPGATLDGAQEAKEDRVCKKLGFKPGDTVLDIGGGWGSFALYANKHYGAKVVMLTISEEQYAYAKKAFEGTDCEVYLMNYLDLPEKGKFPAHHFDHIVSIGAFEHFGRENYAEYMRIMSILLKQKKRMLLHTIGNNDSGGFDPWINRDIFPGGWIPSLNEIVESTKGRFTIECLENFGPDYDATLCAWTKNSDAIAPELLAAGRYDERFFRQRRYYMLYCAGAFRARKLQLYQIVMSVDGDVYRGYR